MDGVTCDGESQARCSFHNHAGSRDKLSLKQRSNIVERTEGSYQQNTACINGLCVPPTAWWQHFRPNVKSMNAASSSNGIQDCHTAIKRASIRN